MKLNSKRFCCLFSKRSASFLGVFLLGSVVFYDLTYLHIGALNHHTNKKRHVTMTGVMRHSSGIVPINETARKTLPSKYLMEQTQQKITKRFLNKPILELKQEKFFMIVFIKSACARSANRQLIRTTYATIRSINNQRFAFIFLIGNSAGNQNNISEEINKFGDILQADVADEYSALPDKVLSAYQWLYYSINNIATFYSFTDDDCFLNILNIYKHFKTNFSTLSNKHKVFCGFHLANEACPERNSKSKYYTSFDTYSKPSYPAFCNGGLTIISYSMLKELYSMAEKTNRNNFTLEDVYITGILRSKLRSSPSNIAELDYTPATIYDEFVLHLGQNPNSKLVLTLFWSYQLKKLLTETDTKFKVEF